MKRKVLVVEDDEAMAVALHDGFEYEGCEVTVARDGVAGLRLARQVAADVIILDVMLPKMSGLEICKRLRAEGSLVPIIMLTARGQEIDKVVGLRIGADDYVTKPFSFMELLARVDAVLRRAHSAPGASGGEDRFAIGDLNVDFQRHEATKGGKHIELSPREFRLLEFFAKHRGEVVTRDQILDAVWGYDTAPFTRTVDTHIAKLRKKVEDSPASPRLILTVHRLGYKFAG
jgi:two-component system alkaline phosphatase synthesis response regulator PhoP